MSQQSDIERRFIEYNVTGIGNDRLTLGNWAFRKHVLLYMRIPYKRFVKDRKGLPLMIRKQTADQKETVFNRPVQAQQDSGGDRIDYLSWTLPDIGVMSRHEGDELTIADLHDRMRYLFFAELREIIDEEIGNSNGKELAVTQKDIRLRVDRMYTRYHNYKVTFGLDWAELPKMYQTEAAEKIEAKLLRYRNPKSVEARERAHARKVAKQAFGIS